MKNKLKELTRAEDEIMQVLWTLEKAVVKDIIEQLPDPKPAYNTVSTIVRILVKKGFVKYKTMGKTHLYLPAVPKSVYSSFYLENFMGRYFSGSFKELVSFFAREKSLSVLEIEELMKHIKKDIKEK
ncbi:MAG: BlaI/MecI/CopY family transcriptional regulator [Cyclobacteriaceae bacterium]|nr:BlaI/MecI/CopY family transcriptional regulator [Cyclobacteriaceae bacterium]